MQCKSGGKNTETNWHKAYTTLQKLSAITFHRGERLVLTKTHLNICVTCVSLTTLQKNKCDNMMLSFQDCNLNDII